MFDEPMDSKSLFLTASTSTLHALPDNNLKRDRATVVEVPDGLLGRRMTATPVTSTI